MLMRLGKDDPLDVNIASVGSSLKDSESFVIVCLCPRCGEYIAENAASCTKCGAVLVEGGKTEKNGQIDLLETQGSIFLCSKCGAFIAEEHTHCLACGETRPPIREEFGITRWTLSSNFSGENHLDTLLETTPSLLICMKCGAFLPPTASRCGICGTEASEGAGLKHSRAAEILEKGGGEFFKDVLSNQGEISICGNCGAFMSMDSDSCSFCGVEKTEILVFEEIVDEKNPHEDGKPSGSSLLMCDQCGAFVSSEAEYCSSCGIDMSVEEPYEDEPMEEMAAESLLEAPHNLVVLEKMNSKAKMQAQCTKEVRVTLVPKQDGTKVQLKWWIRKAGALKKLGRYTEAIDCLNHALQSAPEDIDLLTEKANLCYILNRYEKAAELYKKILEVEPRNISLWNRLGNALFRLNHTKESQICYEKALSLDACNSETIINQGYLFLKQRRYDDAMGLAKKMAA